MPLEFGIEPPRWLTGAVAENTDPLRPLREEQAKNQLLQQTVQLEGEYSKLRHQNAEMANWQREAPGVAAWMQKALDPNTPLGPPPIVTSATGLSNVEKVYQMRERAENWKTQSQIRTQNQKANQSKAQFYQDWVNQFVADPQLNDEISALRQTDPTVNEYGWRTDANGVPIGPSQDASKAMRSSTDRRKLPPLGMTKEQYQAETKKAERESRESIEGKKIESREKIAGEQIASREKIAWDRIHVAEGEPIFHTDPATGTRFVSMPGSKQILRLTPGGTDKNFKIAYAEWRDAVRKLEDATKFGGELAKARGTLKPLEKAVEDAKKKAEALISEPASKQPPPAGWEPTTGGEWLKPSRTNAPPTSQWMSTPHTEATDEATPAARSPEQKLERGKELWKQHPAWTKQQVLDAVAAEEK